MSSVRRPRVEYLGITLSRLFNVLGNGEETAIIVHLADWNEGWVGRTSKWLGAGFADEVEAGRLHAIHAPQALYPLQQAKLAVVMLSGFSSEELNKPFEKREGKRVHGRETYWSKTGKYFIYWCQSEGSVVSHRRWGVAATADYAQVQSGNCPAYARAPEDHEVLDPLVTGWEEWDGKSWVVQAEAGVDRLDVEEGEMLKFGDSPQRQWWRSKQNLDYAFLMWYSANISDYYMQLEDDVQVVPHFLKTVNEFIDRKLLGEQWVMVSFSKLGFIGKFFNATRLPQLAEFLLTFNAEMPCDWLVWVWIDLLSPMPVTPDIPKDLEKEYETRQIAVNNATARKKLPFMRDDLQLFYKASVYGQQVGPKTGTDFGGQQVFGSESAMVDISKPPLDVNGVKMDSFPPATVRSTMKPYEQFDAARAYPPGDSMGFWTADTCSGGGLDGVCDATKKFLEIEFNQPVALRSVRVEMGDAEHPEDYMRNGRLIATPAGCDIQAGTTLGLVTTRLQVFPVQLPYEVACLRLVLEQAQREWVLVKGISVERGKKVEQPLPSLAANEDSHVRSLGAESVPGGASASAATVAPAVGVAGSAVGVAGGAGVPVVGQAAMPHGGEALFSALLAALIGVLAGALGWLAVCLGSKHCHAGLQTVGSFTCWVLTFMLSLDAMFLLMLTPPSPPGTGQSSGTSQAETVPDCQPSATAAPSVGTGSIDSARAPTVATVTDPAIQAPGAAGDYRSLLPGIHRVSFAPLQARGNAAPLPHELVHLGGGGGASASVASAEVANRKWLAVGFVAELSQSPAAAAEVALKIAEVGQGFIVVVLLVERGLGRPGQDRKAFVDALLQQLQGATLVHVLDPPSRFYPSSPMRTQNIDLAFMARYAEPLAGTYMHVEPDCVLSPNFVQDVQAYLGKMVDIPWVVVMFTKLGFTRKLIKARLLPRWAEFLVMFPEVPADTLLWGFIDVVGNETAPKAVYLATDASKRKRPDVILQYHKAEAIIEHLGDVSSLEGKVQRHHEDYFKKHALVDTLFDNPAAKVRTNLRGKNELLQSVYDGSTPAKMITCGGHSAPNCASCPQGHGAAWCNVDCMWVNGGCVSIFKSETVLAVGRRDGPQEAFVELVFDSPLDVEVFNFRMGGGVSAPKKTSSAKKANMPDPDFDHTLDDAEIEFGHDRAGNQGENDPACRTYDHIDVATGREVFWRSPQSRPATDVRCIRVAVRRAQQRPLIIRGIHVRTAHQQAASLHKRPALPAPARQVGLAGQASLRGGPAVLAPGPQVPPAVASAVMPRQEMESWSELHFAWVLLVSVAFVSGAFSGVLGCVGRAFTRRPAARRGRQA